MEYRILVMIGVGKSVSEIANEMTLSVRTISTHRARVLEKLNIRNNANMIRYVIDKQLS